MFRGRELIPCNVTQFRFLGPDGPWASIRLRSGKPAASRMIIAHENGFQRDAGLVR